MSAIYQPTDVARCRQNKRGYRDSLIKTKMDSVVEPISMRLVSGLKIMKICWKYVSFKMYIYNMCLFRFYLAYLNLEHTCITKVHGSDDDWTMSKWIWKS